jgi:predicted ATPase
MVTEREGRMPLLTRIAVRGYKSIERVELPLRPLNVLVGANGSGKSNFISVFELLSAAREGRLARYVANRGGANALLHHGSKHTPEMFVSLAFENGGNENAYELRLGATDADGFAITEERVAFWDTAGYPARTSRRPQRW